MFSKFLASLLANVSEQMILDLIAALFRELHLNRDMKTIDKVNARLDAVIKEVSACEQCTEEDKNEKLINAGRDVVKRMRDN